MATGREPFHPGGDSPWAGGELKSGRAEARPRRGRADQPFGSVTGGAAGAATGSCAGATGAFAYAPGMFDAQAPGATLTQSTPEATPRVVAD